MPVTNITIGRASACIILAFSALLSASEPDSKHSVFGLKLGSPLTIKEAEKTIYKKPPSAIYKYSPTLVFERTFDQAHQITPIKDGTIWLCFPISEKPLLASSNRIIGFLIDGNLEAISFNTRGVEDQQIVLSNLIKKYDNPTENKTVKVKNLNGAEFDSIEAYWELPNLRVSFWGTKTKLTSGHVLIETIKAFNSRIEKLEVLAKNKREL